MKRLVIVAAALLVLTACEAEDSSQAPMEHYTYIQELPDGGSVLCVWARDPYAGGLSCDWEGATR